MKANSSPLLLSILMAFPIAAVALSPEAKEAVDNYVRGKTEAARIMNPILNGIIAEANTRVSAVDDMCKTEIPEITEKAKAFARDVAILEDNLRYMNSVDFNVYNDSKWRTEMLTHVTRLCCALSVRPAAANRFNQRFKGKADAVNPGPRYNGKSFKEKAKEFGR